MNIKKEILFWHEAFWQWGYIFAQEKGIFTQDYHYPLKDDRHCISEQIEAAYRGLA